MYSTLNYAIILKCPTKDTEMTICNPGITATIRCARSEIAYRIEGAILYVLPGNLT